MINGVGRDAPIEENATGYKSSKTPYRMDLMPGAALLHLANIMRYGAENHGDDNWKKGTAREHVNKALIHIMAWLDGDTQDDHLGHSAWRMMAALEVDIQAKRKAENALRAPTGGMPCSND